ncbi:tyrosine/serine protein phosphatase-like protein [Xylona heveae TC161]|uniref:Tyrosine/serine protein phosphatase-like protein n=1 Tax=Xylona heveae (strain CBS 132557 / TC161) TaxID=1328760 RepID=A0A161TF90_XYLHT|nr:tyrosine/serine protein phosphatase-like protein [Xylona heveae TC161]KZF24667.1 tyrosine/serine protein phosphatase-like protein [Xylona heveae TC161]
MSQATLDGILNFRDVGKTVNQKSGSAFVNEGLFFRSARPDDASPASRDELVNKYGISSIIDLRTKSEHIRQAQKRAATVKASAALAPSDAAAAETVEIPGIRYHLINLNGRGFERNLLWQMSWGGMSKLLTLMLFGYRIEAIGVLGREVMQHRGLIGLGCDSIDYCQAEISQVFDVLADRSNYPLIVHCTQGKDRTGLIIALTLFLLGVPIDAVSHDYVLSESELLPEREERLVEIHEIGLTDDFADCPPDWAEKIHTYIDDKYGSVETYLKDHVGVTEEKLQSIREILGIKSENTA